MEEGGEGEAMEEPAVEAAWDAGLLVAEDWLFDSERIDSFIKGSIPGAKMLANCLVRFSLSPVMLPQIHTHPSINPLQTPPKVQL